MCRDVHGVEVCGCRVGWDVGWFKMNGRYTGMSDVLRCSVG